MQAQRFIRTTWLAAILMTASIFVLLFSGYAGSVALFAWRLNLQGVPLPPLSEWLMRSYGYNEWDLLDTHRCFCWAFCILFMASTFMPPAKFRRTFFTGFIVGWSFIVTFWAFLAACAALPHVVALRFFPRPFATLPVLNRYLLWLLPALVVALLIWRLMKLWNHRRRN